MSTDRAEAPGMMRYVIYLSNPDDSIDAGPCSFSSGRYGFKVRAIDMAAAIEATIARAKAEGIYGHDWQARIQPVDDLGHRVRIDDCSADVGIRLCGDAERLWGPGESDWGMHLGTFTKV